MQYTENLNLKKPEPTDPYDIANENENMDTLDESIASVTSQITRLAEDVDDISAAVTNIADEVNALGLSVVDGKLCVTYTV